MSVLKVIKRVGIFLLVTLLIVLIAAVAVLRLMLCGGSETVQKKMVYSLNETSAMKWVPGLPIFLGPEKTAEILTSGEETEYYEQTDTSLVTIAVEQKEETAVSQGPVTDAWGLIDDDGDGIIIERIPGVSYSALLLVVLDPSRVIMGSVTESYGHRGYTVNEMVAHFDAVAGINAGGFMDENGQGNGSTPDTLTVFEGKVYYGGMGCGRGFAGIDSNGILHVGKFTEQEIINAGIQYGACFGPVLINNGQIVVSEDTGSGINPRTAIGQRSDGAILMLAVDGRSPTSLGATFLDEAEILMQYGAVSACNMDGGSSTRMWFNGGYINNAASVKGDRPVPTSFLVLKEGN